MPWPEGHINVGEVFYDRLDNGRYEKCTLGEKGARIGSGEFFQAISPDEVGDYTDDELDSFEMIYDADRCIFVFLMPDPKATTS